MELSVEVVLKGKTIIPHGRVAWIVAWLCEHRERVNAISPLQLTFHAGGPKSDKVTVKLLDEDEVGEEILQEGC